MVKMLNVSPYRPLVKAILPSGPGNVASAGAARARRPPSTASADRNGIRRVERIAHLPFPTGADCRRHDRLLVLSGCPCRPPGYGAVPQSESNVAGGSVVILVSAGLFASFGNW